MIDALMLAIRDRDYRKIDDYLRQDRLVANVNAIIEVFGGISMPLLSYAVMLGDDILIDKLLACPNMIIDMGNPVTGETALLTAVLNNKKSIIEKLIGRGANVNAFMINGSNPLTMAVKSKNIEIIKILLRCKDININHQEEYGMSGLMIAACDGLDEIIELLIDKNVNLDQLDLWGKTALMYAAYNGHFNAAKKLVLAGANVKIEGVNGCSALILAAASANLSLACIDTLLNAGARVNATGFDDFNDRQMNRVRLSNYSGLGLLLLKIASFVSGKIVLDQNIIEILVRCSDDFLANIQLFRRYIVAMLERADAPHQLEIDLQGCCWSSRLVDNLNECLFELLKQTVVTKIILRFSKDEFSIINVNAFDKAIFSPLCSREASLDGSVKLNKVLLHNIKFIKCLVSLCSRLAYNGIKDRDLQSKILSYSYSNNEHKTVLELLKKESAQVKALTFANGWLVSKSSGLGGKIEQLIEQLNSLPQSAKKVRIYLDDIPTQLTFNKINDALPSCVNIIYIKGTQAIVNSWKTEFSKFRPQTDVFIGNARIESGMASFC